MRVTDCAVTPETWSTVSCIVRTFFSTPRPHFSAAASSARPATTA
ncbi:hypothetical protein [Nocardioides mangrovicus]|nr:hypothetical protein [Nocardioides mangrovicus]